MPTCAVALGSNLGDRAATLAAAVARLRAEPGVRVTAVSPFYETAPVGGPAGQGAYLNAALTLDTDRPPHDVLNLLLHVESRFGRVRSVKDAPRTLDLDLLLYGPETLDSPDLTLPHPRLAGRAFVLVPLAAVAAGTIVPGTGATVAELLAKLPAADLADVVPFPPADAAPQVLAGKTAFVTGSTAGIGAAIAAAMRAAGARVLTHGRSARPGDHLSADLSRPGEAARLADAAWETSAGGIDVFVSNAGADTLTGDAAQWPFARKLDTLLEVDLKATMTLGRAIGARMKARGRGVILTVGWDQAECGMEGDSGQLFAAVKGAVTCFSRSLALGLAPEVRVNVLAPGWVRTAWGETASAVWQERVMRETPLGVWGLPDDIAAAAVWLASDAAGFVTGQTLRVNGGAVRA